MGLDDMPTGNDQAKNNPLIADQIIIETSETPGRDVEVTPEYERGLKIAMFSIPYIEGASQQDIEGFVQMTYGDFINSLPAYSKIRIITKATEENRRIISALYPDKEIQFHDHGEDEFFDIWAQDFGEPITVNGQEVFLIPMDFDLSRFSHLHPQVIKPLADSNNRNRIVY